MITIKLADRDGAYAAICEICGAHYQLSAAALEHAFGDSAPVTALVQSALVCACEVSPDEAESVTELTEAAPA